VVTERGAIHWVDLGPAQGSAPVLRRPVLVMQADSFNKSRIATTVVATMTTNTQAAEYPGNVFIPASTSGLPKDSVVNVSQLVTLNKDDLADRVADLPAYLLSEVAQGLRTVLGL
jgi:mRNA interferase MazF